MQEVMLVNPTKSRAKKSTKRKAPAKRRTTTTRKAPAKRQASRRQFRRRTYRQNPAPRTIMRRVIDRQVRPAAVQAVGALGVDYAYGWGSQYLPENLTTGMIRHLTKGAGAVALSTLAAGYMNTTTANELAKGSLTVIMYEAGKEAMESAGLPMGYYSASPVMRRRRSMGYYQRPGGRRLQASTSRAARMGFYQDAPRSIRAGVGNNGALPEPEEAFDSSAID